MAEKQIVCDSCGEQWEESFFCAECSHGGHYEMREVPNIMWDGLPSEEYCWEEEWIDNGDICMNCCGGHTKPNNACTGQLAGAGKADGESTPSANCQ